jgi:hypothetical protein
MMSEKCPDSPKSVPESEAQRMAKAAQDGT